MSAAVERAVGTTGAEQNGARSASANLDIPRFCTTEQLAALFGFSEHWIYKLNKRGKGPPRLTGVRPYRYDTQSLAFHEWLKEMGVSARPYSEGVDTAGNQNV